MSVTGDGVGEMYWNNLVLQFNYSTTTAERSAAIVIEVGR